MSQFLIIFTDAHIRSIPVAPTTPTESSSLLLSVGAPSFGGGGSFETLDFSLPSYNEAVSGDVTSAAPKKEASDFFGGIAGSSSSRSDEDAAAREAAKEDAKRAAAEKKEGACGVMILCACVVC